MSRELPNVDPEMIEKPNVDLLLYGCPGRLLQRAARERRGPFEAR